MVSHRMLRCDSCLHSARKNPTGQLTPINPRRDHQGLAERRLGVVNERRCCLIRGHCVTRNQSRSVSRALANGFTS